MNGICLEAFPLKESVFVAPEHLSTGSVCDVLTSLYHPQSESLVVCDVDEDLVKKLREFRFRKETNNAAIISKLSLKCSNYINFLFLLCISEQFR